MSQTAAHNLSDQLLVEQVLKGNQQAFVLVIRQTEGLVAQIVLKMVRITADRPDIVQDIYLKAYKNLPSFRFNSKLSTWIGKIAYNTCLHYLEKRKLVFLPATSEEKEPEEIFDNLSYNRQAYNVNEGEKRLSSRDLGAALGAAINNLSPPIYQTLITLYHQEEMSYAEIAEITSLPEGTVKNYLFRARKALKENLLSDYQKEEL
ncbi:RNA polymerase sigma-70 factor, ECF subfamily [Chitinophaga terrae (ex Kim and Jung 2007)]|uniref:RNA polymerase sigma-70 factor, ECF subfamily n=1 Tax=Chitinophaga terrae (ex Kim and Jung 2007) TaxID=408074 RepID=A0A1H4F4M6_9BACT|nr:sigma-70 family RNA polymerase sigma factor [Chitinophaga terrae (ex Kim and Jung 2007)]MDQ0106512.1 RNA polymerase sigma-70 factor (ECF subfamily) [Chitinophaga terrae (ex Kim and Jung 2007)]GEP92004.1 RNA polymerase sigma factor [Chitinophaga terrae (ex Kim and Jung 2007)]SEA92209.1 RNA polymerase sigma-70 factor, ECF subfamily [Chitinophaga terrae (ex Kim and Jung 2007)]